MHSQVHPFGSTNSWKWRPEFLSGGSRKKACHYGGRDDQISADFWICYEFSKHLISWTPSINSLDSIARRCWTRSGAPNPAGHLKQFTFDFDWLDLVSHGLTLIYNTGKQIWKPSKSSQKHNFFRQYSNLSSPDGGITWQGSAGKYENRKMAKLVGLRCRPEKAVKLKYRSFPKDTDLQKSLSAWSQSDRSFSWNGLVWQPRVR